MDSDSALETSEWLTIDQLAAATDMTVRNIRAHQSRGLLQPPRIVGRTGWYGPAHRRRLDQIRQMQDEGLNLAAIAMVLVDGRLTDVTAGVFKEAEGTLLDPQELADRLGLEEIGSDAQRAIEAGIISVEGHQVRVESPRLIAVAEQLVAMGVPLGAQLDAVDVLQEVAQRTAEAFMALADAHLVTQLAIETKGDLDEIRTNVEKLHEVAGEALQATFDRAMSDAVAQYFASLANVAPS